MNHEPGLLRAVLDSPGDDTPRLVYADWLDEHGQPERADFIRIQIELARDLQDSSSGTLAMTTAGWTARAKSPTHDVEHCLPVP